jgi:hypothetical protein
MVTYDLYYILSSKMISAYFSLYSLIRETEEAPEGYNVYVSGETTYHPGGAL